MDETKVEPTLAEEQGNVDAKAFSERTTILTKIKKTMKNPHNYWLCLSLAVFVSTHCAEVRAEIGSKVPGDFGWRKSLPLHLITSKQVVDDLGLSPEIAQKLKALHDQVQREVAAELSKPNQKTPNEPYRDPAMKTYQWNTTALHNVRNRHMDEINQLLTAQQQERLYQIHIWKQDRPTDALCDPGVAKALALTGAQVTQIQNKHWAVVDAELKEVMSKGRNNKPSYITLYASVPEAVMKILSEEQRQSFERLQGPPLK